MKNLQELNKPEPFLLVSIIVPKTLGLLSTILMSLMMTLRPSFWAGLLLPSYIILSRVHQKTQS